MRSAPIALLMLASSWTARADFRYTMTQKAPPGQGADQVVKHYLKGQKLEEDRGSRTIILDFGAQTMTSLDNTAKTYTVARFADLASSATEAAAGPDAKVDVQRTGQKKTISGFAASQVLLNMDVDMPQARQAGIKLAMEVELWISQDVPGSQELAAFYKKNAANVPAAAWGDNNPGIQRAMLKLLREIAELNGAPVMQVIRVKLAGGSQTAAQIQRMAEARAQLEALSAQGGPQAAAAQSALARMGAAGGGSLFEMSMTASDFSNSPIADSVFAIPAGYTAAK